MVSEENFVNEINEAWIESIDRKIPRASISIILAEMMAFASYNMFHARGALTFSEGSLKDLLEKYAKEFSWNREQVKRAYFLAHCKISRMNGFRY